MTDYRKKVIRLDGVVVVVVGSYSGWVVTGYIGHPDEGIQTRTEAVKVCSLFQSPEKITSAAKRTTIGIDWS